MKKRSTFRRHRRPTARPQPAFGTEVNSRERRYVVNRGAGPGYTRALKRERDMAADRPIAPPASQGCPRARERAEARARAKVRAAVVKSDARRLVLEAVAAEREAATKRAARKQARRPVRATTERAFRAKGA